jgi:hypothetical protein
MKSINLLSRVNDIKISGKKLSFTEKFRKKEKFLKGYENLSFLNFKEDIKMERKIKKSVKNLRPNLKIINFNSGMRRKVFGSFCSTVRDLFFKKEDFQKFGYTKVKFLRKPSSKFNEFGKFCKVYNKLNLSFKVNNSFLFFQKNKKELNLIFNLKNLN